MLPPDNQQKTLNISSGSPQIAEPVQCRHIENDVVVGFIGLEVEALQLVGPDVTDRLVSNGPQRQKMQSCAALDQHMPLEAILLVPKIVHQPGMAITREPAGQAWIIDIAVNKQGTLVTCRDQKSEIGGNGGSALARKGRRDANVAKSFACKALLTGCSHVAQGMPRLRMWMIESVGEIGRTDAKVALRPVLLCRGGSLSLWPLRQHQARYTTYAFGPRGNLRLLRCHHPAVDQLPRNRDRHRQSTTQHSSCQNDDDPAQIAFVRRREGLCDDPCFRPHLAQTFAQPATARLGCIEP